MYYQLLIKHFYHILNLIHVCIFLCSISHINTFGGNGEKYLYNFSAFICISYRKSKKVMKWLRNQLHCDLTTLTFKCIYVIVLNELPHNSHDGVILTTFIPIVFINYSNFFLPFRYYQCTVGSKSLATLVWHCIIR